MMYSRNYYPFIHKPSGFNSQQNSKYYRPSKYGNTERDKSQYTRPQNFNNIGNSSNYSKNDNSNNVTEDTASTSNMYEQYFEIFGMKLYFDDLLILALIFFLYKEDVKDSSLFIILFLLLLG